MYKKNTIIKIVAISLVLLFLISGLSVIASSPQHLPTLNLNGKNNKKFGLNNSNTGTLKNISSINYFGNVNNSALFGLKNYDIRSNLFLNRSVQANAANAQITVTSAASGLQINSICYGDNIFLMGGENTSSSPLLILFNASSGKLTDISGILTSEFRAVTAISYLNYKFYIAGIPSGNEIPLVILDLKNMTVSSLSSLFPPFVTGPNVYTLSIVGSDLYMGGYYQVNPKSAFLFSYDISNGSVENLTYLLPAYSSMLLTLSSNGYDLFIGGIYGNYSSFALIYNTSSNSLSSVHLPGQIESLSSSAYYDGSFYVGGSSSLGAEFLKIDLNGEVVNLSQSFTNDIQINTINVFDGNVFVGGWAINGSFASIFNTTSMEIMKNIYGSNGWKENGSEMLASSSNGSIIMVGGSVAAQFYNYSGALLGLLNKNYSFVDLSNLIPKTYKSTTYSAPPLQKFYVYASPNIVFDNGNITFVGQGLAKNATYHLYYSNETLSIKTNAEGLFSYSTRIGNLTPGDYLITLADQANTYYNYFAVPYSYGNMIYGSKIPKTGTIGYSNLKDGAVVRDGEYLEFYRQVDGQIPVTSINYLVQWNQILFQNLTSKGWTVAPVNQLGYASQFSINPMTFQYSFWNDYGIVEVSNSNQFKNFPTSNSYIYVNGSEMIVWIPYYIVNETYFPWAFATDYVQESPVYNYNYRIEAGQSFVSWYYGNETPSILTENLNEVQFLQRGYPIGNGWGISIINDTAHLPEYYQNYSSYGTSLSINLPNGNYKYIIIPGDPLYTSSNATGSFVVENNNLSFNIVFQKSPTTIYMQHYTSIREGSSLKFNVSSVINNFASGLYSMNFGSMNSTFNVEIVNASSILYKSTIIGNPFSYVVTEISKSYGYYNFNYSGGNIELIATNVGNITGLFAFNIWDYYISNYTASLITIPPQFSENFNPLGNFTEMYNNTGLSFTLQAPYYKYSMPLAIWIGEGYNNPVTGKFWWAQIGFNNWLYGLNDISFAGWGIFSNIFGSPGGTDGEFPLIPNGTYNFTMEVVSKDTWEFMVNGIPIVEPGLSGFLNTTSNYSNGGITFGFEVLSQARAGSPNLNELLPNPVKIITAMKVRVDGKWTTVPSFSFNNVGENWNNGNSSASNGMDLWGIEGNVQNKSIPQGEFIVGNSNIPLFAIPSYQNNTAYPLYGSYYYPYSNISGFGTFVNIKSYSNGTIYINPLEPNTVVSLLEFNNTSNTLVNFTNYIVNKPIFVKNLFLGSREAMVAASLDNKNWEYGGKFQEIVLTMVSKYNITFTESGLPSGTAWYANLSNGQSFSSTTDTITFTEPNSSYSYAIATSNKEYAPLESVGSFTISGTNMNISVSFHLVTYEITFTESGLPSGTTWSVTLNGATESSTTDTITLSVPNGTYSYTIGSVSGYTASNLNGSVTVSGNNIPVSITFSSTSPPAKQPSSGISRIELYGIIGAVVAIAAIGSAIALVRKRK